MASSRVGRRMRSSSGAHSAARAVPQRTTDEAIERCRCRPCTHRHALLLVCTCASFSDHPLFPHDRSTSCSNVGAPPASVPPLLKHPQSAPPHFESQRRGHQPLHHDHTLMVHHPPHAAFRRSSDRTHDRHMHSPLRATSLVQPSRPPRNPPPPPPSLAPSIRAALSAVWRSSL
jgi:hypothetical protein